MSPEPSDATLKSMLPLLGDDERKLLRLLADRWAPGDIGAGLAEDPDAVMAAILESVRSELQAHGLDGEDLSPYGRELAKLGEHIGRQLMRHRHERSGRRVFQGPFSKYLAGRLPFNEARLLIDVVTRRRPELLTTSVDEASLWDGQEGEPGLLRTIEEAQDVLLREFLEHGLGSDDEPTPYGRDVDAVMNSLSGLRLGSTRTD